MRIPRIPDKELPRLQNLGIICRERSYYYPSWDVEDGNATSPYCGNAELYWECTNPDQVYRDELYIIPFLDEKGSPKQLKRQTPKLCSVIYKANRERTGIAIFPKNKVYIISPPILGISQQGNEPIFINWQNKASVEDIRSLIINAREAFGNTLFALTVRVL